MKKRYVYLLFFMMIHIYGCGRTEQPNVAVQKDIISTEEVQSEKEIQGEEGKIDTTDSNDEFWQEDLRAGTILSDEKYVYFCGESEILKANKQTLETQYIWKSSETKWENDAYAYAGAKGVLVADKLYFIEKWTEETEKEVISMWALSVVCTDGSGYERLESFETDYTVNEERLLVLNGFLFYELLPDRTMKGYKLDGDGVALKAEKISAKPENVPENYWEAYYYENGSNILSALESKERFGYYLLRDEAYEVCIIDPQSGERKEIPRILHGYSLTAVNDEYFLFDSYADGKMMLMDVKTFNVRELVGTDANESVITMDQDYVYLQRLHEGENFTQYKYLRVDLENGYKEEMFTVDAFVGMNADSPWFLMDISIKDNCIYYVGEQDYKLYLMRRSLDMPNAEDIIGEAFYDTGIAEVGRMESYKENIYSSKMPDKKIASLDLEWLVVDERFAGADAINKILESDLPVSKEYMHERAAEYEGWEDFELEEFSFTTNVSPIYYMDGRYLSFVQQNYEYSGGAHSMPFWNGYTFDLETGEQLQLSDIVENDDLQIKEIVTGYFEQMYEKEPDAYWDDAVDVVREYASLQSPFYLSEEGIVFYYGPYELAPYAGGVIEIVIPYNEVKLRINLVR